MLKKKENVAEMVRLSFTLIIVPAAALAGLGMFYGFEILDWLYTEHIAASSRIFPLLMLGFMVMPNWNAVFLPLLIIILVLSASGLGLWFTAIAIQYRDIAYAMNFIVQLLMYAAPVVYPATLIPAWIQPWYALNPMVGVIEGFRSALLGTIPMPWSWIGTGALSAVVIMTTGVVYFRTRERLFADVA